jgi:uncharacterized protein involved in outer membrane biogenesis
MRKWVILGVLLAAAAGAVALALSNLNSYLNRNKDWLAARVESALGRKVTFSEIGVQFLGGFGARIQDLRISDDPAFSEEDFVRAGEVRVAMRIWPALFGRYEVSRVVLVRPEVNVIRTREGFNYETIGKRKGESVAAPPEAPAPEATAPRAARDRAPAGAEQAAFLVAVVDLQKGQFRYRDRTTSPPGDLRVRDLDFSASDASLDRPVRVNLAAALFGAEKQNARLRGSIGPLGSPPNVHSAALDLSVEIGPIVVDEMKKIEALAKALPRELSSTDPVSLAAKVSGSLDRLALEAEFAGSNAAILYGKAFRKPKGVPLDLKLRAERAGSRIDLKSVALRLAALDLAAKGTVDSGRGGLLDLEIDSRKTPLAGWDQLVPAFAGHAVSGTVEVHVRVRGESAGAEAPQISGTVALADVSARQSGSPYEIEGLTSRIELKGDSATIPPTTFKLSGSPVEVAADVASFRPLAANFTLKSSQLTAASLAFASPAAKKPELLRGLEVRGQFRSAKGGAELQGTLRSSEGSLRDVEYRDLDADVTLRDQVATLRKLELRAFDGAYAGGGRYDMREKDDPKFDFRSTIRGMDLKRLLASQSPGSEQRIEGRVDADLVLDGAGKTWEVVKKQLRGSGRIDVRDGMIKDVNIADQVLQSVTGIGGLANLISPRVRERHPGVFATGDTRFEKLGGSVRIEGGVARSDDLTLAARDYAIFGKGTYSLDNDLDCTATLLASKELSDDVIADVREAKYIANAQGKIEIPFRVTGALPRVKAKPDAEFIARALSRAVMGKGLDKIFGREKPPPPGVTPTPDRKHPERELLKKGLEGLFGR